MVYKRIECLNGFTNDAMRSVFGNNARVINNITKECFPNAVLMGDWAKAGGESWYSVANIKTGLMGSQLPVAIKAIESMGDCRSRAYTEADRLVRLAPHAPAVYAVAPCTILKEWLVPDRPSIKDAQLWQDLREFIGQLGITLMDTHIQSAACISGGIAKIYDAGCDMSG